MFFFSGRRLHTRCALVTGVQTCALPISANRVRHIDTAVLRRFTVIHEFVELPRSVKRRMAQKYLGGQAITDAQLDLIAELPELVPAQLENAARSEERRVGKACVSTCRSRWAPFS